MKSVSLSQFERKVIGHDATIRSLFDAIRQLMAPPEKPNREIGFHTVGKERHVQARKNSCRTFPDCCVPSRSPSCWC